MKRDWVLTIAFLVFGFGAIAACGDGQTDSPEACAARGGQWYISSSYTTGGYYVSFGNGQGYVTPVQVHHRYSCTVPEPKETKS